MAEEQQAPAQEDPGTPEQTDEEIWEEIAEEEEEPQQTEVEEKAEEEAPPETETEPEAEEDVQEDVQESEEEPQHDYEKRYKDLEKEFHKRNEESARMREEFNEMRLRMVEQQQAQQNQAPLEPEESEPTPADESFFTEEDRETMQEFSELSSTFQKMIQHELAKAQTGQPQDNTAQRLEELEKAQQQENYQRFLRGHESHMLDTVGDFYRDLDKDPDFQSFVLASPALTNMMTKSADPNDHASVMNLYLDSSGKGDQWRPAEKTAPKATQSKQARRQAASGLAKNSAPRMEKSYDSMSDEELWDAVPEPKDE